MWFRVGLHRPEPGTARSHRGQLEHSSQVHLSRHATTLTLQCAGQLRGRRSTGPVVPQYPTKQKPGAGSLYMYVRRRWPSLFDKTQAQTLTGSMTAQMSRCELKQTVPLEGGWPVVGWGVASHPVRSVPQRLCPVGVVGRRVPAAPLIANQLVSATHVTHA